MSRKAGALLAPLGSALWVLVVLLIALVMAVSALFRLFCRQWMFLLALGIILIIRFAPWR